MFLNQFSIASCIVGAFAMFQPSYAKAPTSYSPRVRQWQEIADEYVSLRNKDLNQRNICLVRAMVKVESNDCKANVSKAGARGCLQLMKDTAKAYGINSDAERDDPESNLPVGIKHAFELIEQHGLILGLKIYNAGPARVDKSVENREYPGKVLFEMEKCLKTKGR